MKLMGNIGNMVGVGCDLGESGELFVDLVSFSAPAIVE